MRPGLVRGFEHRCPFNVNGDQRDLILGMQIDDEGHGERVSSRLRDRPGRIAAHFSPKSGLRGDESPASYKLCLRC